MPDIRELAHVFPKGRGREVLGLEDFCEADIAALEATRAPGAAKRFDGEIVVPAELLDDPRVQALLDWHGRGQPELEIDTSGTPAPTEEQLAEMRPARFRIGRGR